MWQSSRALLFDKDGTIIDFNLKWLNWCRIVSASIFSEKLSEKLALEEIEKKISVWGVDLQKGTVSPGGYLATGSTRVLAESLADELAYAFNSLSEARQSIREAMNYANKKTTNSQMVKALPGATGCIKSLSARGYRLAVVTTDDTEAAVKDLKMAVLEKYFEIILGCDRVASCKPAPDLVLEVCRQLAITPAETAVIGDTPADMLMGKNAEVACRIGVTSGVGEKRDLLDSANLILSGIGEMIRA